MPDGTELDAYRIVPADFDATRRYPVLMYVYGGPAAPQVSDAWGGTRYLWHPSLAQQGYVVGAVDNRGAATEIYPSNPNGSPQGIAGLTTPDGRFTVLMPHPERVFRTVQNSWHPDDWGEDGPLLRIFRNARKWVG